MGVITLYSILVFFHIISALFLGVFLSYPFILHRLFALKGHELKTTLTTILAFSRGGHYALVFLLVSGVWMTMMYSSYPSTLWLIVAMILLILIGGLMGMLLGQLKKGMQAEQPEMYLLEHRTTLTCYGWCLCLFIIVAIFIMTNRNLFV